MEEREHPQRAWYYDRVMVESGVHYGSLTFVDESDHCDRAFFAQLSQLTQEDPLGSSNSLHRTRSILCKDVTNCLPISSLAMPQSVSVLAIDRINGRQKSSLGTRVLLTKLEGCFNIKL